MYLFSQMQNATASPWFLYCVLRRALHRGLPRLAMEVGKKVSWGAWRLENRCRLDHLSWIECESGTPEASSRCTS